MPSASAISPADRYVPFSSSRQQCARTSARINVSSGRGFAGAQASPPSVAMMTLRPLHVQLPSTHPLKAAPDGGRLAIGDAEGTISLWSLESARPLWTAAAAHAGDVLSLDFSPDGSQIVSGGDDGSVKTWRAADGAPGLRRSGHTGAVWKVKFSRGHPSGSYIGSVGTEGDIAWLSAAWAEPASFPATWVHEGRINDLAFAARQLRHRRR